MSLNKQATGRFIKQALAGNDRYDTERAEREARERLLAARKSRTIRSTAPEPVSQIETSASSEQNEEVEDGEVEEEDSEMVDTPFEQPSNGKRKSKKEKGSKKLPRQLMKLKKEKKHKSRRADQKQAGFEGRVEQELVKPG
jgi:exosome complex protein LRP1